MISIIISEIWNYIKKKGRFWNDDFVFLGGDKKSEKWYFYLRCEWYLPLWDNVVEDMIFGQRLKST